MRYPRTIRKQIEAVEAHKRQQIFLSKRRAHTQRKHAIENNSTAKQLYDINL